MTTDNDFLDEVLNKFLIWHWEQFKTGKYEKLGLIPHSHAQQNEAKTAITAHYQAREAKAELEALQWATGGIKEFTEDGREVIFGRMEELKAALKKGSEL